MKVLVLNYVLIVLMGIYHVSYAKGLKGNLIGGAVGSSYTGDVKKKIDSYEFQEDTETSFYPGAIVEIRYEDEAPESAWYIHNLDIDVIRAGRTQLTGIGQFGLEFYYELPGSDWENPYLLNEDREPTTTYHYGSALSFTINLFTGDQYFIAKYYHTTVDYEHDLTKDLYSDLGREGVTKHFDIRVIHNEFHFGLAQIEADCKGIADSSSGNRYLLAFANDIFDTFFLMIEAWQQKDVFKETHPVFNKIREDSTRKFRIFAKGYGEFFWACAIDYLATESNIDLFSHSEWNIAAGVGLEF